MKQLTITATLLLLLISGFAQSDTTQVKKLSYDFSGFINLNTIFDFNGLDKYDDFTTSQIPINPSPYENSYRFHLTARQSRLNFSTIYESPWGKIKGFISGDFYNDNTGITSYFRLREAYIEFGNFLVGQTSTTFGNPNIVPITIDFEGPNSSPVLRNPMIKYTNKLGQGYSFSLAIEMRGTDIHSFPNSYVPFSTIPCLVGNFNKKSSWGEITLTGMVDRTRYYDSDSSRKHTFGYGGAISAIINTWKQNHFSIYLVAGNGVADFISDLSGSGYNGVPNLTTNKLHMLSSMGGFVAYTHNWNKKLSSNIILSYIQLEDTKLLQNEDFKYSTYALANLFYNPFPKFVFGVEFISGGLYVQNNDNGNANRLQFLAQFNF